ncbi:hypothetical protein Taro_019383 [Colocasia esculenta]|uniref:Reverse transcriptase zinc-binding domain-containing protein n=1 Tax=Colocasia esculenta TaxID=4460 RepID=A0A843UTN4_COLES|nr:hypothetical protein [Colocasia esculenta]
MVVMIWGLYQCSPYLKGRPTRMGRPKVIQGVVVAVGVSETFMTYERSSGQQVNASKNGFHISDKVSFVLASRISVLTGYRHQTGYMKYLGIPLKSGRLNVQDFKFLVDNVTRKLVGWRANVLSQAGRVVLIRSVLLSLPVYLASSLSIPKSICNQIALAAKQIWNIFHGDSLWSRYAKQRFLKQSHFSDILVPFPLGISKLIFAKAKEVVLANIRWLGGDGSSVNFYKDTWIGPSPLMHVLRGNPSLAQESHNIMINEMVLDINNPVWSFLNVSPSYVHSLLSTSQDKFIWAANPHGNFTVKSAYDLASSHGVSRSALTKLWHHAIPPRAAVFAWRLLHRAVPVDSRIVECGVPIVSMCSCCKAHAQESLDHLFIFSDNAKELWSWIAPLLSNHINWSTHDMLREVLGVEGFFEFIPSKLPIRPGSFHRFPPCLSVSFLLKSSQQWFVTIRALHDAEDALNLF